MDDLQATASSSQELYYSIECFVLAIGALSKQGAIFLVFAARITLLLVSGPPFLRYHKANLLERLKRCWLEENHLLGWIQSTSACVAAVRCSWLTVRELAIVFRCR